MSHYNIKDIYKHNTGLHLKLINILKINIRVGLGVMSQKRISL